MSYDKQFVSQKAHQLLADAGCKSVPVDLCALGLHQGVHTLRLAPIVPAGIVTADDAGFTIHIRSRNEYVISLREECGVNLNARQRFTLAHEIAHTLFFRKGIGRPEMISGAPSGRRLERLCQFGAACWFCLEASCEV